MFANKEKVILVTGVAVLLCLQCQISFANVYGFGACPTIIPSFTTTTDPFVPAASTAAGGVTTTQVWYLHRRYHTHYKGLTCVTFSISTSQNSTLYTNNVVITGKKPITGATVTVTGTITQKTATNFYNWSAYFSTSATTLTFFPSSLVVAAYGTTYIVLFFCQNYGLFNIQYAWVLTTSASNIDANIATAIQAAAAAGVSDTKYVTVDQDYC